MQLRSVFITFYTASACHAALMADQRPEGVDPHIANLDVSIAQTSSAPLTISVTVVNHNDKPMTFVGYGCPLDDAALALGLLKITPEGADDSLEQTTLALNRLWPPSRDILITIPAGQSVKNDLVLREALFPISSLSGHPTAKLIGNWGPGWALNAKDISDNALENPLNSSGSFDGPFGSNVLKLDLDGAWALPNPMAGDGQQRLQ